MSRASDKQKDSTLDKPESIDSEVSDEDEDEEAAPRTKSKIAECLARFKASMFSGKRSIKEVPSEEFIWQTTEDNWRPGLVTLEQAARSKAIVRRPEAFERF